MLNYKLLVLFYLIFSLPLFADGEHFKNSLIGGRAATMAGAYVAIADDASGSYYNPAGLRYASGDSISGSSNTYSLSKTTYKNTIGGKDWERENQNLLPNFFGLVKKKKKYSLGFSYVVVDSFIEHQDQVHRSITNVSNPIDIYVQNIHTEDSTYLLGPSFAYDFKENISLGISLYYHYRIYRRAYSQFIEYLDDSDDSSYQNILKKEKGIKPILGIMWSPKKRWSVGFTFTHTRLFTAFLDSQQNERVKGQADANYVKSSDLVKRKFPYEFTIGSAYFANPYNLYSFEFKYYIARDNSKKNVFNLSLGHEYFINENNAIRYGVYTNRSNSKNITATTVAPLENINFFGVTFGYTYYSKASAITVGTIYNRGEGKAQIFTNSSATRDLEKYALNFLISADYGF